MLCMSITVLTIGRCGDYLLIWYFQIAINLASLSCLNGYLFDDQVIHLSTCRSKGDRLVYTVFSTVLTHCTLLSNKADKNNNFIVICAL